MNTILSGLLCGLIWGVSGIIGFSIESKREKYDDMSQVPEEFALCLMFGCVSLVIMCIRELFIPESVNQMGELKPTGLLATGFECALLS